MVRVRVPNKVFQRKVTVYERSRAHRLEFSAPRGCIVFLRPGSPRDLVFEIEHSTSSTSRGDLSRLFGPCSIVYPSFSIVWILPPAFSDASKTVTSKPFLFKRNAVVRPEIPPPMTATSFARRPLLRQVAAHCRLFQRRVEQALR